MIKKKTKTTKTKSTKKAKVEEVTEIVTAVEEPIEQPELSADVLAEQIQTTFNEDDIDELGGEVVEGDEPEIDEEVE